MRLESRLLGVVVCASWLAATPGVADEAPVVTAADWQESCSAYLATLRGDEAGDDLKITYCVGQTKGIVEALNTGSQIGAISFASTLTVAFGLDQKQVFTLFEKIRSRGVLDTCPPEDARTATYVETVQAYLQEHPDKAQSSAALVFFEALQQAFPCETTAADE